MNAALQNRLLIFLLMAACAGSAMAGPARFWISPSPTDPFWPGLALSDTLEIDLLADPEAGSLSKAKLYIWAQPATDSMGNFKQLQNMTLDVISRDPLIDFLDNPGDPNDPSNPDERALLYNPLSRFSTTRDGRTAFPNNLGEELELTTKTPSEILDGEPDKILGLQGLNLSTLDPSVGIGPNCVSSELCVSTSHGPAAWRIGSFGIQSIGLTGSVAIHLQIGAGGINHLNDAVNAIEETSMTNVIFSATSQTPVYNAGPSGERQFTDFDNDAPEVRIFISDQLAGDYTDSAAVDGADFLAWQRAFGTSTNLPNRRNSLTGAIGQGDLFVWEANFGKSLLSGSSTLTVPEPSSLLLLFLATVMYSLRRLSPRFRLASYSATPNVQLPSKSKIVRETQGFKMTKISTVCRSPVLFASVVLFLLPSTSFSQSRYWTDAAGNNAWGSNGNWSTDAQGNNALGSFDLDTGNKILIFNRTDLNISQTIFLKNSGSSVTRRPLKLEFRSAGTVNINRGITGNRLRIGSGGIDKVVGTGMVDISTPIKLDLSQEWRNRDTSSRLFITGNVALNNKALTVRGNGNTEISGNLQQIDGTSANGSIVKEGSGWLRLSGANVFSGSTIINGGTIRISSNSNLGLSNLVFGSGNLEIEAGGVNLTRSISLGGGGGTLNTNGFDVTVSGAITGANPFRKTGLGTLTLTGNNTYSLGTTVFSGAIQGAPTSLQGNINVLSGTVAAFTSSGTYSDVLLGAGSVQKHGAGTLTFTGANTFTGGTTVFGGSVAGSPTSLRGNINVLSNTSAIFTSGGTYADVLLGTGVVQKQGSGTLNLTGNNTYSGGTVISAGNLIVSPTTLPTTGNVTVSSGGTFTLGFGGSYGSISQTLIMNGGGVTMENPGIAKWRGNMQLNSDTIVIRSGLSSGEIEGNISGGGKLTTFGNLRLSGTNTYTGGTINNGGLWGNTNSIRGDITNNALVLFDGTETGTYADVMSGSGALLKRSSGTLSLTGSNTYSGGTQLQGGTIVAGSGSTLGTGSVTISPSAVLKGTPTVGGNLTNSGQLLPGNSPGIIVIAGDFTQSATGTLEIEVGGLTPGPGSPNIDDGHDQVRVGGVVTLDGRYDFPIINGFVPSANDEIVFIETFGIGSIAPGSRPAQAFVPGLATADPDLAFRVISNEGPGGDVRLRFVPKTSIFFDDGTNTDADWFEALGWNLDRNPNNVDDTTVGGNLTGAQQRVTVNSVDPTTLQPVAEVRQLEVRDDISEITVGIDSGFSLNSTVGDVSIGDRGIIELNGGTLAVATSQKVNVIESGILSGNGTVIGDVEVGAAVGSSGATLSPGMSAVGMEVGELEITSGDYTQGTGGVLKVDLLGTSASGEFDTLTLNDGDVELDGTLSIKVDTPVVAGEVYTIITADGGSGTFDNIVVEDPNNMAADVYFSPFYGVAPPASGAAFAALSVNDYKSGFLTLQKGDADGRNGVDANDARVFAAVLINNELEGFVIDPDANHFAVLNFLSAFDFSTEGSVDGNQFIDLDDIAGFVQAYSNSQSVSLAAAYATFDAAYSEALSASVPEPSSSVMLCAVVALLAFRRRNRKFSVVDSNRS